MQVTTTKKRERMMRQINLKQGLWIFLLSIGALALVGCGGSGSGEEATSELTVSLTDAEGDFNHYTVDVASLTLHKANGAIVETLPNKVRLDFSKYIEVTEFLSTATVPVGAYTGAQITLDYSDAEISVEDASGNSLPAQALDENGQPLAAVTVDVLFNEHSQFVISPGKPAALTIDFDLESSNEVTINGKSATLTVNPILLASTQVEDDKSRRLRGLLRGVSLDAHTFDVAIRPFRVRLYDFGKITAHTDADTVFEIDGVAYNQSEGLEILAQQTGFTPVVALGVVHYNPRYFLAQEVYAGSSVPWGNRDALKGSVIARSDNTLTVIGATVETDLGHFSFNDKIQVLIDAATGVTRQGDPGNAYSIADLSVGQKVTVLGELSDDGQTLNATGGGHVRMRYSHVSGLVAAVSPLEVDLQQVNRRLVQRYDFSGTGIDPVHDADPDRYEIDSGLLSLNSLGLAEPVRVTGFPTPFGTAPLDFTAKTITDLSELPTKMLMAYGASGSETAVVTLDESGLLLDLASAAGRHHLKQAGAITNIATLASVPFIEPAASGGLYALTRGRRVHIYHSWDRYQAALNDRLIAGQKVVFVIARGKYDAAGLKLTARQVVTRLTE